MGTPLPPIVIEPGRLCPIAWGEGKPFTEPTPSEITIQLHDTVEGQAFDPAWRTELLSPQVLGQDIVNPCEFSVQTFNFTWGWRWELLKTFVVVFNRFSPFLLACSGQPAVLGLKRIDNELPDDGGTVLLGGYAEITFGAV